MADTRGKRSQPPGGDCNRFSKDGIINPAILFRRGQEGFKREEKRMNKPTERPGSDRKKKPFLRRKVCRFCADKKLDIDYKNPRVLRYFVTERGKIIPRRISGNCAKHQREVTAAIKKARNIAILPFTTATD
jgi:small subunit ribosomal protein S18